MDPAESVDDPLDDPRSCGKILAHTIRRFTISLKVSTRFLIVDGKDIANPSALLDISGSILSNLIKRRPICGIKCIALRRAWGTYGMVPIEVLMHMESQPLIDELCISTKAFSHRSSTLCASFCKGSEGCGASGICGASGACNGSDVCMGPEG